MRPVVIHRLRVADALSWSDSLTAEEERRAGRFRFEIDRDRFRAGRGALRHWVGGALGIAPADVVFLEGPHGKPFVQGAPVFFNLSHSGDWIVLALADAEVGVDVELAREDVDVREIAKVVFTSRELEELDSLEPGGAQRRAFYRLWARKEAVLKAWGTGFSLDAKRVHVGLSPAPLEVSLAGLDAVTVEDVVIDARHAGAVAVVI